MKIIRSVGKFGSAPVRHFPARINLSGSPLICQIKLSAFAYADFFCRRRGSGPVPFHFCSVLYKSLFIIYPTLIFILKLSSRLTHKLRYAVPCLVWLLFATCHPPDKIATFKMMIMNLRSKKILYRRFNFLNVTLSGFSKRLLTHRYR